jgi:hypothetical protein
LESAAIELPNAATEPQQEKNIMVLTLKDYSKNGKRANYSGVRGGLSVPLHKFNGGTAPETIDKDNFDQIWAPLSTQKPKLTPEERKAAREAKPKPTLAEQIARREANLAKLKAKAEAGASL